MAKLKEIQVTWGEETFQAIDYHTMRVGSVTASVQLEDGEDINVAAKEIYSTLEAIGQEIFEVKLERYLDRIGLVRKAVQRRRGKS
jgi:hypothetical protein